MPRDPVCGMEVDEKDAAAVSQHQGQTYYFCSAACKQQFDQEAERYATPSPSTQSQRASAQQRIEQAEREAEQAGIPGMELPESEAEIEERTGQREPSPGRERR